MKTSQFDLTKTPIEYFYRKGKVPLTVRIMSFSKMEPATQEGYSKVMQLFMSMEPKPVILLKPGTTVEDSNGQKFHLDVYSIAVIMTYSDKYRRCLFLDFSAGHEEVSIQ